jgi:hypothetical protein
MIKIKNYKISKRIHGFNVEVSVNTTILKSALSLLNVTYYQFQLIGTVGGEIQKVENLIRYVHFDWIGELK